MTEVGRREPDLSPCWLEGGADGDATAEPASFFCLLGRGVGGDGGTADLEVGGRKPDPPAGWLEGGGGGSVTAESKGREPASSFCLLGRGAGGDGGAADSEIGGRKPDPLACWLDWGADGVEAIMGESLRWLNLGAGEGAMNEVEGCEVDPPS